MTLQQTNRTLLEQLLQVLAQINALDYKKELSVFENVSIGQHVRHILEFYKCLLVSTKDNLVDYDQRKRDLEIEQNLNYAVNQCQNIIELLDHHTSNNSIEVNIDLPNNQQFKVQSTFERELAYLLEHTIHHFAIIKIGVLHHFGYVVFPEGFGLAYSTQKHRNTQTIDID